MEFSFACMCGLKKMGIHEDVNKGGEYKNRCMGEVKKMEYGVKNQGLQNGV